MAAPPYKLRNQVIFSPALQGPPGIPGTANYVDWVVVSATGVGPPTGLPNAQASPFATSASQPGVDVDLSFGSVILVAWTPGLASGGTAGLLVVHDHYNLISGTVTITVESSGVVGDKLEVPSARGTYASSVVITSIPAYSMMWKYSPNLNLWLLW